VEVVGVGDDLAVVADVVGDDVGGGRHLAGDAHVEGLLLVGHGERVGEDDARRADYVVVDEVHGLGHLYKKYNHNSNDSIDNNDDNKKE